MLMTAPSVNLMLTTPNPEILMLMAFTSWESDVDDTHPCMDMLKTRNPGSLILTKPIMGNLLFTTLMLMTPTSGNLIFTTRPPGNMMLTTPTLMKESDVDDTHPREFVFDDTHTGESDVENNAPPPPGNLMLTMPQNPTLKELSHGRCPIQVILN